MTQLNPKTIQEIAEKNDTAEMLFTFWADDKRRNARDGVSKIKSIRKRIAKEGFHPVPKDLVTTFKELERAGCGTLRGNTFQWHVGIKEVVKAATQPKALAPVKTPEPVLFNRRATDRKPQVESKERAYRVVVAYLSNDRKVKLEMPADLSHEEAIKVSSLLDGRA